MIRLLILLMLCSYSGGDIKANEDKGVVEVNLTYKCYDGERTTLIPMTYSFPYFIRLGNNNLLASYL